MSVRCLVSLKNRTVDRIIQNLEARIAQLEQENRVLQQRFEQEGRLRRAAELQCQELMNLYKNTRNQLENAEEELFRRDLHKWPA